MNSFLNLTGVTCSSFQKSVKTLNHFVAFGTRTGAILIFDLLSKRVIKIYELDQSQISIAVLNKKLNEQLDFEEFNLAPLAKVNSYCKSIDWVKEKILSVHHDNSIYEWDIKLNEH